MSFRLASVFCAVALWTSPGAWAAAPQPRPQPATRPVRVIAQPPRIAQSTTILAGALRGPLSTADEVIFALRNPYTDPHWYANFGYWSLDAGRMMYGPGGSRLCKLNLRTRQITNLLEDRKGTIRDPQLHYDGKKILFSYRKGESRFFNLYEIDVDGTHLRQITDGEFDDIEPTYLPNDEIVFCSSRCKRWVNCWYTQVAIMYRCDANGRNIRPVSGNTEQDNTPAVLPDGRLLYTRWEYVDRSQVEFHHLWVANPDGTGATIIYGNQHPGVVMIDSRPIPGTTKIASIFSPGHGINEHRGTLTIVSPETGPDSPAGAAPVKGCPPYVRDPYPISSTLFLVSRNNQLLLVDSAAGAFEVIYTANQELHEPALVCQRTREAIIADRAKLGEATGKLVLADVHLGRNTQGVKAGDIRKLLVLESLPKPINFSGGPEPLTYLGTFTLERVLGTVPVEPDGSAFFELPANRQYFFVALDRNDLSVKRMQSWVSVMPGETTGCIGCHEQRTLATPIRHNVLAARRPPSRVEPFVGLPEVIDYPRDIQPILDRHCVSCHSYDKPDGKIILTGDRGPEYSQSYWTLFFSGQVADGANGYGNRSPRSIGTSASKLMRKIDGSHYGAKVSEKEWRLIWMWIESGATYPGTYAALGCGMVYVPVFPARKEDGSDDAAPPAYRIIQSRCYSCHSPRIKGGRLALPSQPSPRRPGSAAYERIVVENDPMLRRSSHVLFNFTRPEKSILLLAPLAKEAGGFGWCRTIKPDGSFGESAPVFRDTRDADCQKLLAVIRRGSEHLNRIKRFDMPGFRPNEHYLREMKRYGILPRDIGPSAPIDPYQLDRAYWESLWWRGPDKPMAASP